MKSLSPIFLVLGVVSANDVLHAKWSSFKATHGKTYSPSEEALRLKAFTSKLRRIETHNAQYAKGDVPYYLGLNALSDLTGDENRSARLGAIVDVPSRAKLNASVAKLSMPNAPAFVDWREDAVTPVKNQVFCGSCYTFAAVAAIESVLLKTTKKRHDFSEQQLVDCSYHRYGNNTYNLGCDGGDPATTFEHALKYGLHKERRYPYVSGKTEVHSKCKALKGSFKLDNLQLMQVDAGDENALAEALAFYGPIAVTLNGENDEFYDYAGGIYDNPDCKTEINHAVLLVGYGEQDGKKYWIIKNSWGSDWGEQGFMKLARGINRCGIVSEASYFLVAA